MEVGERKRKERIAEREFGGKLRGRGKSGHKGALDTRLMALKPSRRVVEGGLLLWTTKRRSS